MDHQQAPLLDALAEYHDLGRYGFTPPGHRQGRGADPRTRAVLGPDTFRSDVLVSAGLDDRSSSNGYLKQAEELMADAVGADHAFFSTCGSSLSVKAAMLAVAGGHGDLLVSRDAHKSVVAGLIFSGLQPRWIRPRWDTTLHLAHPPSPEEVEATWARYPDAAGALAVSPTPYGTCADIAAIAEICHARGKPLIIDEAWGAHLPFHDDLPTWAMDAGADVCVVSVHKMGAGFEQGSVFHVQGDLVDPSRLAACADLLMTTSPNVLIYSAMDGWRRQMVEHGAELLDAALGVARGVRPQIDDLPGLHVLEDELLGAEASHDLDRLQVLIAVAGLGISGYQAADWLRANCRIDVGLSDHQRIEATLSMADDETTTHRLIDALSQLIAAAPTLESPPAVRLPDPTGLELETVELPRDAFFGPAHAVAARQAIGQVAAEQITPYPPGIPAIIPGERISAEVVEYLESGLQAGMVLPDPADPTLKTIRVTAGGQ
jgi:arginine/lysine/ornithine decarboxylase